LYGYRESDGRYGESVLFYVLPEPFKSHVAKGFNKDAVARVLHEAGMLKKPASGEGWQIRTPRLKHMKGARLRVYGLLLAQDHDDEGG
ncbi:DNA primase, partial [Escherichia coli]|nr:DNA primase [Escherichia coli]